MKVVNPNSKAERLHLGSGLKAPAGWLNLDGSWQVVLARHSRLRWLMGWLGLMPRAQAKIPWPKNVCRVNVRKRLPFPNNRFSVVYSSHLLEHLHRHEALQLLRECRRVLKPEGVCRAVVPDLEHLVQTYIQSKQSQSNLSKDPAREFIHSLHLRSDKSQSGSWFYQTYQGFTDFHTHKWMYDRESLKILFAEAGFKEIEAKDFLESRIVGIEQVEEESRVNHGCGVCVEGLKPE